MSNLSKLKNEVLFQYLALGCAKNWRSINGKRHHSNQSIENFKDTHVIHERPKLRFMVD